MDAVNDLVNGKVKFHELDEKLGKKQATEARRKAIEKMCKVELKHVGNCTLDPESLIGKNIENMIGSIQIPLGVAGPLKVNGDFAKGDFYLPLATTEGALVASVSRGCSVITKSGGANVKVIKNLQTRAPCFRTGNIKEAVALVDWVKKNFDKVKAKAEETSKSGSFKLENIEPFILGNNVYLRFEGTTGDAMGMNMITIATEAACEFITSQTKAEFIATSGNVCVDKKASSLNFILGRGKSVVADVLIPDKLITDTLKTTSDLFVDVNTRKNLLGSIASQSTGFNAHFANVLKAIFKATGQDLAHVVNGSTGVTWAEKRKDGVYISVTIPDLHVGTVGGGTRTETAQECLKILGVYGGSEPRGQNALKFAEIIAAAVLAGEISLIGALAAHHLGKAHKEMGR